MKQQMGQLDPAVEQQLTDMSEEDWHALTKRVRGPAFPRQDPGSTDGFGADGVAEAKRRYGRR